jgi:tetratricopeptide (TPR) repeat protein
LAQPEQLLSNLIREVRSSSVSLVSHILLANVSPIDAAETLFNSSPHTSNQVLLALQENGEIPLAEAYAETTNGISVDPNGDLTSDSVMNLLASTSRDLLNGDFENAHQNLNKAWETASHTTGLVADKLAEIALLEGDPVVEVEARQQALRSHPTPVRHAWLGFALLQLDHPEDALASLQHDPDTFEELIAVGLILSKLGETTQAAKSFDQAVLQLPNTAYCNDRLLKYLLDGLKSIGEVEQALRVARFRVHCRPTNIECLVDLSQMLDLAGDPQIAAEQAHLALVLDPSSTSARFALAHSLQADGRPEAALPHWQTLVTTEPDALTNLAM